MATWIWDGFVKADVPEEWIVKDAPDLIEILPPEPVGALQISLFRVPSGDVTMQCVSAVENFVEKQAGSMLGDLRSEDRGTEMAVVGEFQSVQSGRTLSWLIAAVGGLGKVALATYCYGGKREQRAQQAEGILESIRLA